MFHIQMDTLHLPDESAAREVNRHKQSLAHSSSPDLRSQSPRLELQKKHPLRHPRRHHHSHGKRLLYRRREVCR